VAHVPPWGGRFRQAIVGEFEGMINDVVNRWTADDASELFDVAHWGKGYFSVSPDGHLLVHPERDPNRFVDLWEIVEQAYQEGCELPILFRFGGILRSRLQEIHAAFSQAIAEYGYQGQHTSVYPIKVNPQRQVIEDLVRFGKPLGVGLEIGSKPELLAVMSLADPGSLIVCNGFKDREFVELAMLAQQTGRRVIPVIEKKSDLHLIMAAAQQFGIRPQMGVRAKLAARGSGRWQLSGGYLSKFGLSATELLEVVDLLKNYGMADCLQLLHFHMGSQVTNIRKLKNALNEAAQIYAGLVQRGANLQVLDVGGGLGVDYDGSQTDFASSVNYSLQEYGNDVVYHIQMICDQQNIPHPDIITECGRAMVAFQSALVFGTLGVTRHGVENCEPLSEASRLSQPIRDLNDTLVAVNPRNVLESFHDAQQALETAVNLFGTGNLSLDDRARTEQMFWAICRKIRRIVESMEYVPDELAQMDRFLSDTYFCNFSVFESLPDSWAIKQLFPILPIHRLNERPTRPAVLADITCDSDGLIDRFTDRRDVKKTLLLHPPDGKLYVLGAFLTGAYQEVLGGVHNLLGDTHVIHVDLDDSGQVLIEKASSGDTVSDVVTYVQFSRDQMVDQMKWIVQQAQERGEMTDRQADECLRYYEDSLEGYTYLEDIELDA
jgi:arginine decarboxylase